VTVEEELEGLELENALGGAAADIPTQEAPPFTDFMIFPVFKVATNTSIFVFGMAITASHVWFTVGSIACQEVMNVSSSEGGVRNDTVGRCS